MQRLLEPLSDNASCGENLEYDPAFAKMEREAQGTPEQQYGDTIIEAKEPEWGDIKETAVELLERTKDLRIGMYLTRAVLKTDGVPGFRDCLALLRGYIEKYWDQVHPQLDPDDDNDPTIRVNTLATLCDLGAIINVLRAVPIVRSRTIGQFSRRDVALATGEIPPPQGMAPDAVPKMSAIDGAFQDCDLAQLEETTTATTEAVAHVKGIETALTMQVGSGNARSLDALVKELEGIRKILVERLARRGHSDAGAVAAETPAGEDGQAAAASGTAGAAPVRNFVQNWDVEITSRDDAIRAIGKVCKYFERCEPSSPLPLLLNRAIRLSTKSFLEIMRDISPDGVTQAEALGGVKSSDGSSENY